MVYDIFWCAMFREKVRDVPTHSVRDIPGFCAGSSERVCAMFRYMDVIGVDKDIFLVLLCLREVLTNENQCCLIKNKSDVRCTATRCVIKSVYRNIAHATLPTIAD